MQNKALKDQKFYTEFRVIHKLFFVLLQLYENLLYLFSSNSLILDVGLLQSWVIGVWKAKEYLRTGQEPKQRWDRQPKTVQDLEDHQELAEKRSKKEFPLLVIYAFSLQFSRYGLHNFLKDTIWQNFFIIFCL